MLSNRYMSFTFFFLLVAFIYLAIKLKLGALAASRCLCNWIM